jgi:PTH1 family peptidyl-tRNA hydrolase
MHLLVGLGNCGIEYENTRHNFGFLLIDKIIARHKLVSQKKKFKSDFFAGEIFGKKVLALKPQTFMNLSGLAVLEAIKFYKIPLSNVIIFHDDLDLAFAKIKYKIGGGNGGHNGLKSIDENIGKEYARIRLGIGRPEHLKYEISDYVLSKFSKEELEIVEKINQKISDNFLELLNDNPQNFLNKIHL